jgi:steroid 5-alpha reductase family enzyme
MDVAWGLGFIVVTLTSFTHTINIDARHVLVLALILLWGVRLAVRIGMRNFGKPEDFRYAKWRSEWGKTFILRSFFQIYVLQGLLLLIIALPVLQILNSHGEALGVLDLLGVVTWIIGYYYEVRGDWELDQFKKNPLNKGKLMMSGLWSRTRHPNYFGEACMWWGIWLLAIASSGLTLPALISIIGPITITTLLLKVSGVPMVEKAMQGHPDFPKYQASTPVFIPKIL